MSNMPLRALLVEDVENDALLVLRQLKHGGFEVTSERVDTAEAFEAALKQRTWDIVLADYQISGFGGTEALKILKSLNLDVPFVLVSGHITGEIAVGLMKLGACDFIFKNDLTRLVPVVVRELHEAEIRIENRLLQKVKDNFIETVSHELRTPLAIIKTSSCNLRDGVAGLLTEKQAKLAAMTVRNADRLTRIINDLLDTAQLESGNANILHEWMDLAALVHESLERIRKTVGDRLVLTVKADNDLPRFNIDGARIAQALGNILDNAQRFARTHVEVRVKFLRTASQDIGVNVAGVVFPAVQITVSDDGVGIAPEHLVRLFNKFEQVNRSAGGSGYGGTGLGLYIARQIILKHHGMLWAQSALGEGSHFHILLPVDVAGHELTTVTDLPHAATADFKPENEKTLGRILVIEDENDMVFAVTCPLETKGYSVTSAADGVAGLAKARAELPDLILLDLLMPGLSGESVCRELKKDPATRAIPVIIFTAQVIPPERNLKQETGADAVIAKPFLMDDILLLMETFMKK